MGPGRVGRRGLGSGKAVRIVAALAALGVSGCAYVTAQPVKPGDKVNGIRIYDVKPLLVVSGENVTIQYVPNYNRAYALRFGAFLAKNNFEANVSNGILTSVKADMDTTAIIELLKAFAEKIPEGFSGPPSPDTPGGIKDRFQVYDIVFDDDGNLVGLRPLLAAPNMLRVTTARALSSGGGGTVVDQPGAGGGGDVTPGPIEEGQG